MESGSRPEVGRTMFKFSNPLRLRLPRRLRKVRFKTKRQTPKHIKPGMQKFSRVVPKEDNDIYGCFSP